MNQLLLICLLILAMALGAAITLVLVLHGRLTSLERAEITRRLRDEHAERERAKLRQIQASAVNGNITLHPQHPDALPEPQRRKRHLGLYLGGGGCLAAIGGWIRQMYTPRARMTLTALTATSAATAGTLVCVTTVPDVSHIEQPPSVVSPTGQPHDGVLPGGQLVSRPSLSPSSSSSLSPRPSSSASASPSPSVSPTPSVSSSASPNPSTVPTPENWGHRPGDQAPVSPQPSASPSGGTPGTGNSGMPPRQGGSHGGGSGRRWGSGKNSPTSGASSTPQPTMPPQLIVPPQADTSSLLCVAVPLIDTSACLDN